MKNKISKIMNSLKEKSPEILIATGVGGMITSSVLAVRATPKAMSLIEDKKKELNTDVLTTKETIETTWKQYIPAVGVGVASVACIVGGTSMNLKKNAALSTVCTISERALREFQNETRKIVSEEDYRKINASVARARAKQPIEKDFESESTKIINTGDGETLILDSFSGRFFKSSRNAIDRAINEVNKSLLNEMYVSVNELYNELNIPTILAGSLIGWQADYELIDVCFEPDVDENGTPFLTMVYHNLPRPLPKRY